MGLTESVKSTLDDLLAVTPFSGWGWCYIDESSPTGYGSETGEPAPFHARVLGFIDVQGEFRGAKLKIEEPGHALDGWFAVFTTRHKGEFDLVSSIPDCNIEIGPRLAPSEYPKVTGEGSRAGFAEIKR